MKKQFRFKTGIISILAVSALAALLSGCTQEKDLGYAYIVNIGGGEGTVPGISIIDRKKGDLVKTFTFDNQAGTRIGHFGNVSPDGKELWNGSGQGADVHHGASNLNVYDTAALLKYDSLTDENKGNIIKHTFTSGVGVQNAITPDGNFVFISADQDDKGIQVFNAKTYEYLGNIANDNTAPHVGDFSKDGKKYYTTTAEKHKIVGYDVSHLSHGDVPTESDKFLDLDVGYGNLHALRLHPNGKYLFVGDGALEPEEKPEGFVSHTGVNVIDLTQNPPAIIKTVAGRPHNFAISPDAKYLVSTELKFTAVSSASDCSAPPEDLGERLQFIDISTLLTDAPDPAQIKEVYSFDSSGWGGSHAGWDYDTGLLYYTVYASADIPDCNVTKGDGWAFVLNTEGLADTVRSVTLVNKFKVGWNPHGVIFPGRNGD